MKLKTLIIGLGNQGQKRKRFIGDNYIASVDPFNSVAEYRNLLDVPIESFDSAILCTPDSEKYESLKYLVANGKHVLVEKPLITSNVQGYKEIEFAAIQKNVLVRTAYNHRFEPGFIQIKKYLEEYAIGDLYSIRCFYGNGTARLNRDSAWRDSGSGVIDDLGSHLLDTIAFWMQDQKPKNYSLVSANNFENLSPDHAVIASLFSVPRIELEMTLLMWKNTFHCDILGKSGSLHMNGLCKWGPSEIILRKRKMPSGVPDEIKMKFPAGDPTWELEYADFKKSILNVEKTDFSNDFLIHDTLRNLWN